MLPPVFRDRNSPYEGYAMKKIATLLLAAGLLFSAAGMAQAIDFKIRGQWIMAFDYGEHGAFTGGNGMTGYKKGNEDNFEARQRLRLQLDAAVSDDHFRDLLFESGRLCDDVRRSAEYHHRNLARIFI